MIDRESLDLVLDQVFTTTAVAAPDAYIASAVAQARRSLNHGDARSFPPRSHDLDAWLQTSSLGPYETRLLATLVHSPGPVIVLRGGTGSGKSSILGYLTRHLATAAKKLPADATAFPFRRFFVQVDVQTFPAANGGDRSEGKEIGLILRNIANALVAVIGTLGEAELSSIIDATLVEAADAEAMGIRQTVAFGVRQRCQELSETWDSLSGAVRFRVLQKAASERSPQDELVLWLSALRSVHRALNDGKIHGTQWPLVVILDNIDPLSPTQQVQLLETLSQMTSGPSWGNFKIVLAMRLSTYSTYVGAWRFNHYDHAAPDAAELVLVRTTLALLAPEAFPGFTNSNRETQVAFYDVLLELFSHLVDGDGGFFDLFSAISGTNLRHAFNHAHRWCLASQVSSAPHEAWRKIEFQQHLTRVLCRHYLEELAARIGREYRYVMDDVAARMEITQFDASAVARELYHGVLRVLGSAEACVQFSADDPSPRALLGKKLQGGLSRELSAGLEDQERRDATLCRMLKSCHESDLRRGVTKSQFERISNALADRLELGNTQGALMDALLRWLAGGIRKCLATPLDARHWRRVRSGSSGAELRPVSDPESNRFVAETLLLSSRSPKGQEVPQVLNMFAVSGAQPCAVLLRILYVLKYRGQADVTRQQLIQSLTHHQYTDGEIRTAMSDAMSLPHRLVYSGIDDHFVSMTEWLGSPSRVVRLSSAGAGYLDVLLNVPAYAQWALRPIGEARTRAAQKGGDSRTVRSRLRWVLSGFQSVVQDERQRIEEAWKAQRNPSRELVQCAELPIQNACADAFLRVLDPFMHVYRTNFQKISSSDPAEARELASDAEEWVRQAKAMVDDHEKLFGCSVADWKLALRSAEADLVLMVHQKSPPMRPRPRR